jgi:hypothetical protein
VRYIPRKRCVFRYGVEWKRAADAATNGAPTAMLQHIWAKVYDDAEAAEAAHQIVAALWRAALADSRWLRVPRPLVPDLERAHRVPGGGTR